MTPQTLLPLLLLLLPSLLHAARLRIVEANASGGVTVWRRGPVLRPPTTTLCPTRRFPEFTIQCLARRRATSATFFLDGVRVRTERVVPFILTGDRNGVAAPFVPPAETVSVRCETDDGEMVEVEVTFRCRGMRPRMTVAPTPVTVPDMGPGGVGETGIENGDGCVKIGALEFVSVVGAWEVVGDALAYKMDDPSTGVDGPGDAPVEYRFVAPVTSKYGVTLDMETAGGVDHNDVFLEFPAGGFTLNKANGETRTATGWTKAYHNRNGRALEAFSVDFNPHVFTTSLQLKAGDMYTIRVGGRSTMTTIHAVVLFPCAGVVCQGGSEFFRAANRCNV